MKYKYDLHIHSALSPCAENNMTPSLIAGQAKLLGLDFIAVSDHNAIENVEATMKCGEEYGIKVVPAVEIQTNEDIHILCLFESYNDLVSFYKRIDFGTLKNNKEIFGDQLIIDEDDNVKGEEERMLLNSCSLSSEQVYKLAKRFNGLAVPAHIDRDMNGMLQILGCVPSMFKTVEISSKANKAFIKGFKASKKVILDSDAHEIESLSTEGYVYLDEYSVAALLNRLRG